MIPCVDVVLIVTKMRRVGHCQICFVDQFAEEICHCDKMNEQRRSIGRHVQMNLKVLVDRID